MSEIQVALPGGKIVSVFSGEHTEEELRRVVVARQEIASNYCESKGWPTLFENLSLDQILEIRALPEWINAAK